MSDAPVLSPAAAPGKTRLPEPRPDLEGQAWVEDRRPRWRELEEKLAFLDAGSAHWSEREVEDFAAAYRRAASDLLEARAGRASPAVGDYLNDLVGRGYMRLYTWSRPRTSSAWNFFYLEFPRLVRQHWHYLALSFTCFLLGFLLGFARLNADPQLRYFLLPYAHQQITPADRVIEDTAISRRMDQVGEVTRTSVSFATFLTLHNIRVALLAFALGILGGVLTAAVLFTNGLTMGALAADYYLAAKEQALHHPGLRHDIWTFFWAWILPHGIPELMAVFIAASGGFLLGRAAVAPGRLSTREALARAAVPATALLLGTLPMFLVAGLIEATVSQLHPPAIPLLWKLFIALMIALALGGYLFGFGRRKAAPMESGQDVWHRVGRGGVLEILTPEHVVFRYRLAGLATRAGAMAIDLIWILFGSLVLGFVLGLLFRVMPTGSAWLPFARGFGLALVIVTVVYFILLERPRSTTPGKKALRLKVLDQRGLGLGASQRVLRNAFRIADLVPGFYLVGLSSAMLGRLRQRLGDRAAGTVVIEEGRAELPLTPEMERSWSTDRLGEVQRRAIADELSPQERDLLLQLAVRRQRLSLQARLRLTGRAREYFERRTGWDCPDGMPDERYLNALAHAVLERERALSGRAEAALDALPDDAETDGGDDDNAPGSQRRRRYTGRVTRKAVSKRGRKR